MADVDVVPGLGAFEAGGSAAGRVEAAEAGGKLIGGEAREGSVEEVGKEGRGEDVKEEEEEEQGGKEEFADDDEEDLARCGHGTHGPCELSGSKWIVDNFSLHVRTEGAMDDGKGGVEDGFFAEAGFKPSPEVGIGTCKNCLFELNGGNMARALRGCGSEAFESTSF